MNIHTDIEIDARTLAMATELTPLYCRPKGQSKPGPAFIQIAPARRRVYAGSEPTLHGAVPLSVWHEIDIRIPVHPNVRGETLVAWLKAEATTELIQRICDGWSSEFDPVQSRSVGNLDEDAADARDELEALADHALSAQITEYWEDVVLWFAGAQIRDLWPDIPLDDAAEKLASEAEANQVYFEAGCESVRDALLAVALKHFRNAPEMLDDHHVVTLRELDLISACAAQSWRDERTGEND